MNSFHVYCQGASHIAVDKVCQDYAFSYSRFGTSIAIVCDGHGGDRYFRSDVGARFAADVTYESIKALLKNESIFGEAMKKMEFTQVEALTTQRQKGNLEKETNLDLVFRQLFKSIIAGWHSKIQEHSESNPLTEEEREKVPEKYLLDFSQHLEKTYGCTLIAAVATRNYWLAFQIGDGKCISFDKTGNWMEPIPWDDNCFLNKTTSLCDSDAIDEFRYCYGGKGTHPSAIFLGSDGIDDSFGETENMVNFYIQVSKLIGSSKNGKEDAVKSLNEDLPQLSKIGSKDDMSVACIFDAPEIKKSLPLLIQWQIDRLEAKQRQTNALLQSSLAKKEHFEPIQSVSQQNAIEYQYACSDIEKHLKSIEILEKQLYKLRQELN